MTKRDAIIGLYHADAHIKDNKAAKSTKIHSLWYGEEVKKAWQYQRLSQKRTLSLMLYGNQHQSHSREGKEGLKTLYDKNGSWF